MRKQVFFYVGEFPKGFTNENRINAHGALQSMGRQGTRHAELNTSVRSNTIEYDEEGVLVNMGTEWIISGGFYEEELTKEFVVSQMAPVLDMPEAAVSNQLEYITFESETEMQQHIAANSVTFSERVIF